ncbi:MAG: carbamoyltransferase [Elusimicrobia bacterium]|nr:carbamoyltransferase [Elusimicrobiota bacterium]
MYCLGLSAYYHDSAAALIQDGAIVAAAQEERFSRKKHDEAFPAGAVAWCLERAGVSASGLDAVAFYDKPLLKFERILETYLARAPRGLGSFRTAMPVWAKQKLWTRELLRQGLEGYSGPIHFLEHHESHAASAFYPSPFQEAAVLTMDGVGEWATSSIGRGEGAGLEVLKELHFPHSLGLLYSAFTYYTGFKVNSGEYKVMGLAPYGEPRYKDRILRELVDLRPDGSLKLNMDYFGYCDGLTMTSERFHALFEGPPRRPESELTQRVKDLAASVQAVCEEAMLKMAREAMRAAGSRNLCLAGGVALNCVGNGRILREAGVDGLWVQPAAGDAGGALGAALFTWHRLQGQPRRADGKTDAMRGAFLGPSYADAEVESCLKEAGAVFARTTPEEVARKLADGAVVGWFSGALEFGPRALGGRSILADPREPGMRSRLNLKTKRRESFRPFAPAVLRERAGEYFELDGASPYMLLTARVKGGLPAVTHVDGSARVQTVAREDNAPFHALLEAFERLTGCAVLVNTSFNVRGEPVVTSPGQAYACFMRTDMDYLAIGPFLLDKKLQPARGSWDKEFALD